MLRGDDADNVDALHFSLESLAEATRRFLQSKDKPDKDQALSPAATPRRKAAPPSQQGSPLGPKRRVASGEAGPSKRSRVESPATPPSRPLSASPLYSPSVAGSPSSVYGKPRTINPKTGLIYRSKTAKTQAKALLGVYCLVIKVDDIEMAHIIPFSWNGNEAQRTTTQSLIERICSMFDIDSQLGSLFFAGVGSSDKPWNLVPLSPGIHDGWGKAYFGLRLVGTLPVPVEDEQEAKDLVVRIQLQFVWMSRKTSTRDHTGKPISPKSDAIDLANERRAFEQVGISNEKEKELKATSIISHATSIGKIPDRKRVFDVMSTAQVYSGQVLQVKMPFSMAEKFTTAIKIQWALISMAAISGAADAVEHGWRDPSPGPDMAAVGRERDDDEDVFESVETRIKCDGT
jgi:hypothetical protein